MNEYWGALIGLGLGSVLAYCIGYFGTLYGEKRRR
jgi:hypothetical protein